MVLASFRVEAPVFDRRLTHLLLRKTFFEHFCAGESSQEPGKMVFALDVLDVQRSLMLWVKTEATSWGTVTTHFFKKLFGMFARVRGFLTHIKVPKGCKLLPPGHLAKDERVAEIQCGELSAKLLRSLLFCFFKQLKKSP